MVENPGFPLNKRTFDPVIHPGIADAYRARRQDGDFVKSTYFYRTSFA